MSKPGDIFRKVTGREVPDSIQEIEKNVAEQHGLKDLPARIYPSSLVTSRSVIPIGDYPIDKIDAEIDSFLNK